MTNPFKEEQGVRNLRKITGLALIALAVLTLAATAGAQQKFSTTIYFDYTFNLTNDGYLTNDKLVPPPITNQFRFRRAYFRYDNKVSDTLSFRFLYDADNTANLTGASLTGNPATIATKKDDKLRPYIKNLYLDWSGLLPDSDLKIGMVNTITFQLAEDKWGYRSVAKTMVDNFKDFTGTDIRASSADLGLNFTGMATKGLRYGAEVVSGEGYSHPEYDKYKKVAGYLEVIPVAGLSVIGYVDYEPRDASHKALTYKGDIYFEMVPNLTLAGEYVTYNSDLNMNTVNLSHFNVDGYSVWGVYKIMVDYLNAFARFDHYVPNSTISSKNQDLIILGLDWIPVSTTWKLQPNVLISDYADVNKKTDITAQMTFFMAF
jgi:hypothetical protein